MSNWKNIFKSWAGVPVLILLALLVIWSINSLFPVLRSKYESWQTRRAYEKLSEPYYKDTYGGKTPEETYNLFISALKNGDTDLASKYFVIEDQESWNKTLSEYQKAGLLNSFIAELENNKKSWKSGDKDEKRMTFLYPYTRNEPIVTELPIAEGKTQKLTLPAGTFNAEVVFSKYPTGIWKIESL